MTRTALAVLLLPLLAPAAPVPKTTPKKLEDVYGEIADPKGECKFEMGKSGALTIIVPTTLPANLLYVGAPYAPMVGKSVDGDFVLTTKVSVAFPETAGRRNKRDKAMVWAGVSMLVAGSKNGATAGILHHEDPKWRGTWRAGIVEGKLHASSTQGGGLFAMGSDTYLRVHRRGEEVVVEVSKDSKEWKKFTSHNAEGLAGPVIIGPAVCGCIDDEYSATFDQYEIKQLPKDEKK